MKFFGVRDPISIGYSGPVVLYAVYSLTFVITHIIVVSVGAKCMGETSQKKCSVLSFTRVGAKKKFCV
jgi:hypothetical protein